MITMNLISSETITSMTKLIYEKMQCRGLKNKTKNVICFGCKSRCLKAQKQNKQTNLKPYNYITIKIRFKYLLNVFICLKIRFFKFAFVKIM